MPDLLATGDRDWGELDDALELALRPVLEGPGPRVVLFSGGLDSGLLAWELRNEDGTSLFTVGVPGAADLGSARAAAQLLGLPWSGRELDDGTLASLCREVDADLDGVPGPRRGIFVALASAIALAPLGRLVCGQGADELFLGYAHYRGLAPELASRRAEEDLELLRRQDLPRCAALADRWGRTLHAPYLAPAFVQAVQRIPIEERLPRESAKSVLRRFARHRGLPVALSEAPKRALQYGSGVDRWLRRRARHPSP